MKYIIFIISLLLVISCKDTNSENESVTFIVEVPNDTPTDKDVYISGNFEGWSGGREQFKLDKEDDRHTITIPAHQKDIQYKFTLGSWDYVERDAKGSNIENRFYTFNKANDVVEIKVISWAEPDVNPTANSTASKNVTVLDNAMKIPQLDRERRIWIYTPPNYENSEESYPVLYIHDGQNVFDVATSYAGEWEVDEVLDKLQTLNGLELIVVGIDNGDEHRMNEYAPWDNPRIENPEGDAYLDFIVNTLKPRIDSTYRTKTDKANTGIMGSSMGGLISHYAGLRHPDVFGKVGVFSPSFWISEKGFDYAKSRSALEDNKMFFLIGTKEGGDMVEDMERMVDVMKANGFKASNLKSNIVEGGTHSEGFWRSEFPEVICWLFDKTLPENFQMETQVTAKKVTDVTLAGGTLMRVDKFPTQNITPRPVDIWLPENYSEDKKYAVLYMHDGQMLFDANTTWNGQEWKVDEWASRLMKERKTKDFIVVAIHNISEIRWQDLFPQKAMSYLSDEAKDKLTKYALQRNANVELKGDDYLKFIVEDVKPFIDTTYSVHTNKENTFVAGSSMGGLMSMYAISEYPDVFEAAACISTHWVGGHVMEDNPLPEAIFEYMKANLAASESHRLYFDYGNMTLDAHYPQYAPRVNEILASKGYNKTNSKNLFFEGTDHSENSWNQRLDQPLTFLLGN
ncbi:alpha/beta hydrolase-fold protein [Winogradskyella sp. 3972H.M.0a.05]|uniref:alpha/beta hydrolase-fold protein n=1 Tax=Winogradskyella sp. 3972H.M.0a.05 TaxID=2950277 RepID=UPI003399B807